MCFLLCLYVALNFSPWKLVWDWVHKEDEDWTDAEAVIVGLRYVGRTGHDLGSTRDKFGRRIRWGFFGLYAKHDHKNFHLAIFYLCLEHLRCKLPSQVYAPSCTSLHQICPNNALNGTVRVFVWVRLWNLTLLRFRICCSVELSILDQRNNGPLDTGTFLTVNTCIWYQKLGSYEAADWTTHLSRADWWLRDIHKIQLDFSTRASVKTHLKCHIFLWLLTNIFVCIYFTDSQS